MSSFALNLKDEFNMSTKSKMCLLTSLALAAFVCTEHVLAQPNLSVHGYLTQAYAFTDGHQIFGIPEDGTTDYRNLALQFRYDLDAKSDIIFQFSHKRLGLSPTMAFEPEVKVDWAFARYRFNDATSLKFGKVQLPMGIYNEVRDVGVLLPFYRAPYNFYREGSWTSETLDGIVLATSFKKDSPWNLDVQVFYGGWHMLQDIFEGSLGLALLRSEDGLGAQLWLNTPLDEMRLGFGAQRYTVSGGIFSFLSDKNWNTLTASFDANLKRFIAQVEYQKIHFPFGSVTICYGHTGFMLSDFFSVHGQIDWGKFGAEKFEPFLLAPAEKTFQTDYALGLKYAFSLNIVIKMETHWTEGFIIDDNPPNFLFSPPAKTKYSIISLSASF